MSQLALISQRLSLTFDRSSMYFIVLHTIFALFAALFLAAGAQSNATDASLTPAPIPNFETLFVGTILSSGTEDSTQGPFGTRVHIPSDGRVLNFAY